MKLLAGASDEARQALRDCCGSTRWIDAMINRRPFESLEALTAAASSAFDSLSKPDWLEAFASHPRIGDRQPGILTGERSADWSAREQAAASATDDETRAALADANRAYEEHFGHIYLVSASGRSADELLADCLARMANDPETELQVAAGEQRRITNLRLARLVEQMP